MGESKERREYIEMLRVSDRLLRGIQSGGGIDGIDNKKRHKDIAVDDKTERIFAAMYHWEAEHGTLRAPTAQRKLAFNAFIEGYQLGCRCVTEAADNYCENLCPLMQHLKKKEASDD